jgi:hypothetical protein
MFPIVEVLIAAVRNIQDDAPGGNAFGRNRDHELERVHADLVSQVIVDFRMGKNSKRFMLYLH